MPFQIISVGHDVDSADHTHARPEGYPHWLAGYLLQGSSLLTTNGVTMLYPPGWFGVLPPEVGYSVKFGGGELPWTSYWMFFQVSGKEKELLDLPPMPSGHRGVILRGLPCESDVRDTFREARRWVVEGKPDAMHFAANALERILLLVRDAVRENTLGRSHDERIEEIKRYMRNHLDTPHSVASCAKRVHLSPPRFAALFRQETGLTPMRYLERLRLCRAQELLLRTSMNISEIADDIGFSNQHHFSTRFRKHTGQCPRDYRHAPARSIE